MSDAFETTYRGILAIRSSIEVAEDMIPGIDLSGYEESVEYDALCITWKEEGYPSLILVWHYETPEKITWVWREYGKYIEETFPVGCPPNRENVKAKLLTLRSKK